jgi:hypothetical protein
VRLPDALDQGDHPNPADFRAKETRAYRARGRAGTHKAAGRAQASATIDPARIDVAGVDFVAKGGSATADFATIGRIATVIRCPAFRIDP